MPRTIYWGIVVSACCLVSYPFQMQVLARTDPKRWQGAPPPVDTGGSREAGVPASQWLVLDTGGTGGPFDQGGDPRQNLRDVAFWSDGVHGVACGEAGAFYSDNGGLTWRRIRQHPSKEYPDENSKCAIIYYQIELSGPREIWLAEGQHPLGGRHLWHSTDAGQTWEDAAKRFPESGWSVWDLLARGEHVWLLGGWAPQTSYRSDDGGKTWSKLELPKDFEPYKAATPTSEPLNELKTVYLLGARPSSHRTPCLFRSDDGGRNWREIALPDPEKLPWDFSLATIAFATPETGMIGLKASGSKAISHGVWEKDPGASASVLVTTDGGKNWIRRELPDEKLFVSALWLDSVNPSHGLVGVWNGVGSPPGRPALYETLDGGRTWSVSLRDGKQVNAIFGFDGRRIWAVGDVPGFASNDLVAILESGPTAVCAPDTRTKREQY